jgi:hypothetical protein
MKDGKRIVYVKKGNGYEQREVKVESETESRAVIAGVDEGTRVAFVDPTVPQKRPGSNSGTGSHEGTL